MNNVAYFEIQASNPASLLTFYATIFGWNFVKEEFVPIEYYRIETMGINGGLLKRPATTPPPGFGTNAFTCSIMVENYDTTSELVVANGGQIALPKFAIPGRCWQGYFIDPDHNVFGIFQPDENAK
jgi:uncharacterized protein